MKLIVSEKNIAAKRIADILAVGKPKADKVYTTPVYRFKRDGEEWVAIGLKGHIMGVDFPEGFGKWKLEELAGLVGAPVEKVPAEKGIIQSLKKLAKEAEVAIIATDYDREGELIGADARDIVVKANPKLDTYRARFSAITKGEIDRAFAELGPLDENLADAGEARQDIDLIWGAVLTRYLTLTSNKAAQRKWGSVLSAGRVQTPTLKLIVDREIEREAFVPEDYWQMRGAFEAVDGTPFTAGHATDRFKDQATADAAMAAVAGATTGRVTAVDKSSRQQKPPTPFNTTALQAAAAAEGISPAQTMRVAESLYMDGLISYPRVDNTVYPPSLELRTILDTLGGVAMYREAVNRIKAAGPLNPSRGAKETTDHPPIHPTGAADPDKLTGQAWKLYNLIARRFMATLSPAAVVEGTKASIDVAGETFIARGDVLVVPGYRAVYPFGSKKDEQLPALTEGDVVAFGGATLEAKQTQPPARYSQGKLIQEMEKAGLGTKATRHEIIQTLYDRKYVINDPAEPTCQGRSVIEALTSFADRITTPGMTRELEADMDSIAEGHNGRPQVVDHSRQLLGDVMDKLLTNVEPVGVLLKKAADEDAKLGTCPKSGHDLMVRYSPKTKGYFVACSGYPECDVTYSLPQASRYESVPEVCPECGTPQVTLFNFRAKPQTICLNLECPTRFEPEVDLGECGTIMEGGEICTGRLMVHRNPKTLKRYARCTNYEQCDSSYPLPAQGDIKPTGERCTTLKVAEPVAPAEGEAPVEPKPPCDSPVIEIQTRRGPWKVCINPDCSTRPPRAASPRGRYGRAAGKSAAAGKTAAKKPAARKAPAKKTTRSSTTKKK
jgi:DNA topoisomerase-1